MYIRFLLAIKSPDFFTQEILLLIPFFTSPPSPNAYAEGKLKERNIALKRQQAELAKVQGRYDLMRGLGMDYNNYNRDKSRIAVLEPRIQKILDSISYWKKY